MNSHLHQQILRRPQQDQLSRYNDRKLPSGRLAEQEVQKFLVSEGFEILAVNYHSRQGELDIIAYKSGLMIFAEVKARKSIKYGQPFEFVTELKQRRIKQTAKIYLQHCYKELEDQPVNFRYDVFSFLLSSKECIWYTDAFQGEA